MLARLLRATRPHARQIAFFAVLILVFVLFDRPWRGLPPTPTEADISRQWNESIAKLGIQPIFPPQEDIYVGDIYAILIDVDKSVDQTFLGTSVLVGHADVRWAFAAKSRDLPIFADTKVRGAADGGEQNRSEIKPPEQYKDNPINLSLVAFPGVTISHNVQSSASLGLSRGKAGTQQTDDELEQIHIPIAETYGIAPADAVASLTAWCRAEATKHRCTRDFALTMLSFAAGDAFLKKQKDQREPAVAMLMIYRVYGTREFDIVRSKRVSRGRSLGASATPAAATVEKDGAATPAAADLALATSQAFSAEEGVKQVFSRPVIFGYRSIQRGLSKGSK